MTDAQTPRPGGFATDRETLERESDVTFFKSTGPGGQHRNKRETGVRLHHPPSGVTVLAVERRSQTRNLETSYEELAERLRALNYVPKKRRATRVSKSAKEKRLAEKQHQSEKKSTRRPPDDQ